MFAAVLSLSLVTAQGFAAAPATESPEEYANRIIQEMNNDDPTLQQLQSQYGIGETTTKTSYFVTEYTYTNDTTKRTLSENNIESKVTVFDEYPEAFIHQLETQAGTQTITPGQAVTKDFSVLQVTLSYSKIQYTTSDMYYVKNSFVWTKLPSPGYTTNIMGVIGLAFNPQLSIDGASLQGRYYYDRYVALGSGGGNNLSTAVTFDVPTTTYGMGASFNFTHQKGQGLADYLTAFSGYVGCVAIKSNSDDQYCSTLAIYEDVSSFGLLSSEVSISFPAGVSFSFGAVHTPYNVQDSLTLR
jgi:hypothetical protein